MYLDYFYGKEAEQFAFYMIPKIMMQDEFAALSSDEKLLYGLLLSRNTLSTKNGWLDDLGRVYIIYTIDSIMEDMHCCKQKAIKILANLEEYGLIKKKRQGLGKPSLIYVMNFATNLSDKIFPSKPDEETAFSKIENAEKINDNNPSDFPSLEKTCENHTSGGMAENEPPKMKCDYHTSRSMTDAEKKTCENHTSGSSSPKNPENIEKCENHTSRDVKIILQEVCFSDPNYNNNKYNNTYIYNQSSNHTGINDLYDDKHEIDPDMTKKEDGLIDHEERHYDYAALIDENIDMNIIADLTKDEKDLFTDLVNLIKHTVNLKNPVIKVRGNCYEGDTVRSVFLKLRSRHIMFVINNLKTIDLTTIRNRKAYFQASLYSAYLDDIKGPVDTQPKNKFNQFQQRRNVDYDEIERILIAKSMQQTGTDL